MKALIILLAAVGAIEAGVAVGELYCMMVQRQENADIVRREFAHYVDGPRHCAYPGASADCIEATLIGPFDPTAAPDGPYFEDSFYDNTGRGYYVPDGRGCQGVSDDTAAFQAAIDYATGKQPKLPLITCYVIFDGKPYRLQSFTDTGGKP